LIGLSAPSYTKLGEDTVITPSAQIQYTIVGMEGTKMTEYITLSKQFLRILGTSFDLVE